MGCRILEGKKDGNGHGACFYCSTTEWAFGPVFADADEAEAFMKWLPLDPREYSDLESKYSEFRMTYDPDADPEEDEDDGQETPTVPPINEPASVAG